MDIPANRGRWRPLWSFVLISALGCSSTMSGDERAEGPPPVTVRGTIRVKGKPLAHAVVTFLPASGPAVGTGETDEEGKYTLSSMGRPGLPPGEYKVSVSYLLSAEGEPQGLGPRGALVQPPGMLSAKEQLPAEYADLGRTILAAKVGSEGGSFDYDLDADVKPAATKPAPDSSAPKKDQAEAAPPKPSSKETQG